MMILRLLMAAVRKGPSGALERVPSAGSRNKPIGAPLRAIHPNSSPVYKTQSETALSAGLEKLTINDKKNNLLPKRAFSSQTSSNGLVKNLSDAAKLLQNETVKNVVVVAGAGISTPSGIPDFRSPGTGLYDNLQQYNIPYPEAIFDIDYFFVNPRPFFTLAKELYPSGKYRPNYIHYFARQLFDKGLLLRMYTQNIDGLERLAGLPAEKLVEAHGTFATATCTTCRQKMEGSEIKDKIFSDKLPRCPTRGCVGIVKPDIVFFGEDLPRKFYSYMKDMLQADLVLVMGTSLEVQPFAGIIDTVRYNVPRVLFNREAVGPFRFNRRTQDVVVTGDLIDNMVKFATQIGWKEDMVELITKQEGKFVIETRKRIPSKGLPLSKPPPGKQLNKSPVTQTNQNKVNNYNRGYVRQKPTFDLYDSDSSSAESTESDSDVTSSDSSEEESRKGRFRGLNRGKILNNTVRNGAIRNNGVRSTSAKLSDTNGKHELHTQRNSGKYSPAESLTGRSVKSESAINTTLAKRRLENGKNVTPTLDNKPKGKNDNVTPHSKNEIPPVTERQKVQQAERDKVLKKYGLGSQPVLNNLNKFPKPSNSTVSNGSISNNGAKTPVDKIATANSVIKATVEMKERPLKAVKSDSAITCSGYFVEDQNHIKEVKKNAFGEADKKPAHDTSEENTTNAFEDRRSNAFEDRRSNAFEDRGSNAFEDRGSNAFAGRRTKAFEEKEKLVEMDAYIANEIETFRRQRNMKHIESLDSVRNVEGSVKMKDEEQNHLTRSTPTENKVPHSFEVKKKEEQSPQLVGQDSSNLEKMSTDKMDKCINDNNEDTSILENPRMVEHNAWKKETSARDRVLQLLDKRSEDTVNIDSCSSSVTDRNLNRNDKGSKILSEKTAKSFHKYAKVASHKREGAKKRGKKKHRINKKDRPPPGAKSVTERTQLKTVNSRPYGYAHRQATIVKGVGPFNRTNIRTLSSAMERTNADLTVRSGSADLPKISYRHQIQPTSTYDTHVFGTRSSLLVSPDVDGNASENSR